MKTTSIYMMIIGIIIMVIGCFMFNGLNTVNAVESQRLTININGFRSFHWPIYTGFILFMVGTIFNIASWDQPGHRIH